MIISWKKITEIFFKHWKSMPICSWTGAVRGTDAKFLSLSVLSLHIQLQYRCKHAKISGSMIIGDACHRVISECPFINLPAHAQSVFDDVINRMQYSEHNILCNFTHQVNVENTLSFLQYLSCSLNAQHSMAQHTGFMGRGDHPYSEVTITWHSRNHDKLWLIWSFFLSFFFFL